MKVLRCMEDRGRSMGIVPISGRVTCESIHVVDSCRYRNTYILFRRSAPIIWPERYSRSFLVWSEPPMRPHPAKGNTMAVKLSELPISSANDRMRVAACFGLVAPRARSTIS